MSLIINLEIISVGNVKKMNHVYQHKKNHPILNGFFYLF